MVDLDPQTTEDRLEAKEELRRLPLLDKEHNICVGTTIAAAEDELMHTTLEKNVDLFVWTTSDMPGVSPDIMTTRFQYSRKRTRLCRRRGSMVTRKGSHPRKKPRSSSRPAPFVKPDTRHGWPT